MHFFFLSQKVPVNEPPPCSPVGALERAACLLGLFYISLKFLIKIPLNTEIFPFYQRPYKRSIPPCSPKAGPLLTQTPISRTLLSISFGDLSKGALPPGSPHRAPSERDTPLPEPLLHLSVKVPGKWAPFQVPQQGPHEQRCLFPEPSFT